MQGLGCRVSGEEFRPYGHWSLAETESGMLVLGWRHSSAGLHQGRRDEASLMRAEKFL